jgi:hypothetical protein
MLYDILTQMSFSSSSVVCVHACVCFCVCVHVCVCVGGGCLQTLCLSIFPTNKNHMDLNMGIMEATTLHSPRNHLTLDFSHSFSDWQCTLLHCLA